MLNNRSSQSGKTLTALTAKQQYQRTKQQTRAQKHRQQCRRYIPGHFCILVDQQTLLKQKACEQQQYNGNRPSERQIQEAVDSTNKELTKLETNLRFSIHKKTRQIVVKIIDTNTQEIIKEVPSEKILDMVASMMERAGLILDRKG